MSLRAALIWHSTGFSGGILAAVWCLGIAARDVLKGEPVAYYVMLAACWSMFSVLMMGLGVFTYMIEKRTR